MAQQQIRAFSEGNNVQTIEGYIFNGIETTLNTIHDQLAQSPLASHNTATQLQGKINAITVPILFIHSEDDTFAPINDVKQLAQEVSNKTCWWIAQPSRHACHHLKHAQEYQKQLMNFITKALS